MRLVCLFFKVILNWEAFTLPHCNTTVPINGTAKAVSKALRELVDSQDLHCSQQPLQEQTTPSYRWLRSLPEQSSMTLLPNCEFYHQVD